MTKARGKILLTKDPDSTIKDSKDKKDKKATEKDRTEKDRMELDEDALFDRVKKVIKKSRRKLSEEKFEKQLLRTIAFLKDLQSKLVGANNSDDVPGGKKRTKVAKKAKPKSANKKKSAAAAFKQSPTSSAKTNK
jgi:hypothetical protein